MKARDLAFTASQLVTKPTRAQAAQRWAEIVGAVGDWQLDLVPWRAAAKFARARIRCPAVAAQRRVLQPDLQSRLDARDEIRAADVGARYWRNCGS